MKVLWDPCCWGNSPSQLIDTGRTQTMFSIKQCVRPVSISWEAELPQQQGPHNTSTRTLGIEVDLVIGERRNEHKLVCQEL